MLDHLIERAASWLRMHEQAAQGLTVRHSPRRPSHGGGAGDVSAAPPRTRRCSRRPPGASWNGCTCRRLPLRLLGMELSPLTTPDRQGELFPDPVRERAGRLTACKDDIRQRFGFMALVSGTALELAGRLEHDRDNYHLRTPCLTR